MTQDEILSVLPFALVVLTALAVILVDLFWPRRDGLVMAVAVGGMLIALVGTLAIGTSGAVNAGLLAAAILARKYPAIRDMLARYRQAQTEAVGESPV